MVRIISKKSLFKCFINFVEFEIRLFSPEFIFPHFVNIGNLYFFNNTVFFNFRQLLKINRFRDTEHKNRKSKTPITLSFL